MDDIRTSVRDFILKECLRGENAENLKDDTELRRSWILDSGSILRLVMLIEQRGGFEIPAQDVNDANFRSINDIVSYVERQTTNAR